MDFNLHKEHKVCLMNPFTKPSNVYLKKNHRFQNRILELREDSTLSFSYEYTPLVVDLTTST